MSSLMKFSLHVERLTDGLQRDPNPNQTQLEKEAGKAAAKSSKGDDLSCFLLCHSHNLSSCQGSRQILYNIGYIFASLMSQSDVGLKDSLKGRRSDFLHHILQCGFDNVLAVREHTREMGSTLAQLDQAFVVRLRCFFQAKHQFSGQDGLQWQC